MLLFKKNNCLILVMNTMEKLFYLYFFLKLWTAPLLYSFKQLVKSTDFLYYKQLESLTPSSFLFIIFIATYNIEQSIKINVSLIQDCIFRISLITTCVMYMYSQVHVPIQGFIKKFQQQEKGVKGVTLQENIFKEAPHPSKNSQRLLTVSRRILHSKRSLNSPISNA